MGKQVNFYMLEEDEKEFVEFVLGDGKTVILGHGSLQEVPPILGRLPIEDPSPPLFRNYVYFWKPGYPLFMRYIVMKAGPLQGQGVYLVDDLTSSVIEFSRSFFSPIRENSLTRGRIWAEMRYWEGNNLIYKGEEFERWYDSIARWLRKRYQKIGSKPYFYIGPHAYRWYQAGGNLQS